MKIIKIDYKNNQILLLENNVIVKVLKEVVIGKNGVTSNKKEGDLCTPMGLYDLGFAFGLEDNKYNYSYYKINENVYWIDDSNSIYYNHWIELSNKKIEYPYKYMESSNKIEWKSAEHLIKYPIEYELAIVIEYNVNPPIQNKGSAIFLHIINKTITSGCIATTKENIIYILKWLDKDKGKILV